MLLQLAKIQWSTLVLGQRIARGSPRAWPRPNYVEVPINPIQRCEHVLRLGRRRAGRFKLRLQRRAGGRDGLFAQLRSFLSLLLGDRELEARLERIEHRRSALALALTDNTVVIAVLGARHESGRELSSITDPTPHVRVDGVYIREVDPNRPDYATKRNAWRALRAGFAALGYADETGPSERMIGDAEAAGDQETAAIVRALRPPVY